MNSFLARLYECKKSRDTVNKNVLPQPHASEESEGGELIESQPHVDETITRDHTIESNADLASPSTQRRRKNPPELQEAGKDMKEAISTRNRILSAKKVTVAEDDCDRYGKILGNKLRTLPELDRLQLMYEIDGLFIRKKQFIQHQQQFIQHQQQFIQQQQTDQFLPSAKRRYHVPSPTHSPSQLSSPYSPYSKPVTIQILPRRPPSSCSLPSSSFHSHPPYQQIQPSNKTLRILSDDIISGWTSQSRTESGDVVNEAHNNATFPK